MNRLPSPKKTAYFLTGALAVILLVSAFSILRAAWISSGQERPGGSAKLEIYQNGVLIQSISLAQVSETYSFTVVGEGNAYNIITVSPDGAWVSEASCPDKLCIRQGALPSSLLPITCLPNRLVIRLADDSPKETENGADALTY